MSFRKPSYRTLIVVDLATRKVVETREENMNGGCDCARITKPIYELVKSGKGIMYYAHKPSELRIPVEINGRYFAKPANYALGCKPGAKVPADAMTPKVRKFYSIDGYKDGTDYVEYDGNTFICILNDGSRHPNPHWTIECINMWLKEGTIIERT
jgi:hypothetical protein